MTQRPGRSPLQPEDWAEGLRRWRNQPLEREPDVQRTRTLWRALLALVIAALPAGIYLLQQNECLKLTYAVSELRAQQSELAEEERRLVSRHAGLESLTRVEDWAENNGLERPQPGSVRVLRDGVRGPADGSQTVAVARAPGGYVTAHD